MFIASAFLALSALIGTAYGHARLQEPAGFGRLQNMDPFLNRSPLEANAPFCKGLQAAGNAPTVQWPAGSQQTFTLELDMAAHNGGSMQASISFDGGATFKVMKSFISGFPRNLGGNTPDPNQAYTFTVPADAKAGPAIFSWSWSNHTGNREFYHDCSPVEITGSGTSTLGNLPDIFVANLATLGAGCTNAEGAAVEYPNPGADVERGNGPGGAAPPQGTCGSVSSVPPPAGGAPPPPPPPPAAGVIGGGASHTVAAGEFCASIAAASGISVADLLAKNPSVNAGCTNLQVGQVLQLRKRSRVMRNIA